MPPMNPRQLLSAALLCLAGAAGGALLDPFGLAREAQAKGDEEAAPPTKAFFSPGGGIEAGLLETIKSAKKEIVVAMYNFTSRPLAEALVRAKQRGIDVRVVLDKNENRSANKYTKLWDLRKGNVLVRTFALGKNDDDQQIRYHHKFMVIDREVVCTGSFNWTSQADAENFENEVVIGSKRLAAEFRAEFEKNWGKAEDESVKKAQDN